MQRKEKRKEQKMGEPFDLEVMIDRVVEKTFEKAEDPLDWISMPVWPRGLLVWINEDGTFTGYYKDGNRKKIYRQTQLR